MLCCVVDLEPCLLAALVYSSVGRALCPVSGVSWVHVPPRAAPLRTVGVALLIHVYLKVTIIKGENILRTGGIYSAFCVYANVRARKAHVHAHAQSVLVHHGKFC